MKTKFINEGLRDKLNGPTENDIDKKIKELYSQEALDFLFNIFKNLRLKITPINKNNHLYYRYNELILDYDINTGSMLVSNDFIDEMHRYVYEDKLILQLIRYVAQRVFNITQPFYVW